MAYSSTCKRDFFSIFSIVADPSLGKRHQLHFFGDIVIRAVDNSFLIFYPFTKRRRDGAQPCSKICWQRVIIFVFGEQQGALSRFLQRTILLPPTNICYTTVIYLTSGFQKS